MLRRCSMLFLVALVPLAVFGREVAVGLKPNCEITSVGCQCKVDLGHGEETKTYDNVDDCKKSVEAQTAENKKALNKEIQQKYGGFKDNCFPKPSGGCKCNVDEGQGETVREFSEDKDCKKSLELQTAEHKKELNEEIKEKFGGFRENCFPKPSGGCKCNEKDANGHEVVTAYNDPEQCKTRSRRDVGVRAQMQPSNPNPQAQKTRISSGSNYDVRDPVRERAQANYAAVLDELHNKFKGLKEGCYPRPKGCLCVIGKTAEGRDITDRRMNDADCKCKEGERGPGCPAA